MRRDERIHDIKSELPEARRAFLAGVRWRQEYPLVNRGDLAETVKARPTRIAGFPVLRRSRAEVDPELITGMSSGLVRAAPERRWLRLAVAITVENCVLTDDLVARET